MRWMAQSLLVGGGVLLVALALVASLLVIITIVPGLRGHQMFTQAELHSGVGRVAFVGRSNMGACDIFIMNADGSGQVNLTDSPEIDAAPTWSPDGTRIVFSTYQENHRGIIVTNLNGVMTPLVDRGWSPAWSPDGNHIVFVSDKDGSRDLYLVSADGALQQRLTNSLLQEQHPTWSPDNTRIAFSTGHNESVYVINIDGSDQRKLGDGHSPTWSPDSTHLAFTSPQSGILITDVMGTTVQTLNVGTHPHWSPDGTHFAFLTIFKAGVRASLGVVQVDGSNLRILIEDIPWDTDFQWSPNGQWLVFTNGATLEPEHRSISVINIDGSERTWLADGSQPTWQPQP